MFSYYDVVLKWTLNTTQKKASEEVEGKKWPDRINGTLLLSSKVNLNDLVDKAC